MCQFYLTPDAVGDLRVYLSGPIEFALDGGANWRDKVTADLVEVGFRPEHIFDPCRKMLPSGHPLDGMAEGAAIREARAAQDYENLCATMDVIVHYDLRLVDRSDLVIAHWPKLGLNPFNSLVQEFERVLANHVPCSIAQRRLRGSFERLTRRAANLRADTFGTPHEIVVARQQKKPVLLAWDGGLKEASAWMTWLVGWENVLPSLEAVVERVRAIVEGRWPVSDREWSLTRAGRCAPRGV